MLLSQSHTRHGRGSCAQRAAGPAGPGSEARKRERLDHTCGDILHSSIQPVPGPTVIRREQGLLQLEWDRGTLPIPPGDEDKEHEPSEHN